MPPEIRSFPLVVPRTARLAAFGPPPAEARELWVVIHGYGELAAGFLAGCRALDDGQRLVVAPEALSRFYDTSSVAAGGSHTEARVGASWMTREDREHEIDDYVAYLDRVVDSLCEGMTTPPPVHVLAFSQGTATASRWVGMGRVRPVRLVIWGGVIAPELDLSSPGAPLRQVRTHFVVGSRDKWATPELVAKEQARLEAAGFVYQAHRFEGGHRLDDATLRAIAAS